jgi:SAM-dependent methyltransferase
VVFDAVKRTLLDYHHRTSRIPYGKRVVASLAKYVGRADSLLDVGCGDGNNMLALGASIGATRMNGVDVHIRPGAAVEVKSYDGTHIPFPDRSFEAVSIIDVLHHCDDPLAVLKETLRVADRVVVIKDHFVFGPLTNKVVYWIDQVGNAKDGIRVTGTYFEPHQWVEMISAAGGRIGALDWPLKTHDLPWSLVGRPELQFTAMVLPIR